MVEKIDRPKEPPAYQITRAKDAKEDQHQSPSQREEHERKYQKELAEGKEWTKFDKRERTIKPLKTTRDKITKCTFRAVALHGGSGILQVNVFWKDGKITEGALVLLKKLEDFMTLKKFRQGQDVPEIFWTRGTNVEFGIVSIVAHAAPPARNVGDAGSVAQQKKTRNILNSLGLLNAAGKLNWGIIFLYLFFLSIITAVIIIEVR